MLDLQAVSKQFAGSHRAALQPLSLQIRSGELLVILGSSGSGKSTLLKLLNRLLIPSSGQIVLHNKNLADYDPVQLRRSIGYVFQGVGLLPHINVADNVSTVPRLRGESATSCERIAREQLELVNLDPDEFAGRMPSELSGGQQQRVGVARALATGADLLLMDEPFGALDAITRDQLQQELLQLKQALNKTIVFVTHDIFEAMTLADRIAVLHDGELQQIGNPAEVLHQPATDFVSQLIQKPIQQLQQFNNV